MAQPSAFAIITVFFPFLSVLRAFVREMKIEREVQTMVVGQLVSVALAEILDRSYLRIYIRLRHQCSSVAGSIDPSAGDVDARRDLVLQRDTQVVLTVVFSVDRLAVVNLIELPHRAAGPIFRWAKNSTP